MTEPRAFLFLLVLLAASSLLLVGLFALARRFPSGLPPHKQWILWAVMASIQVTACVGFFIDGETVRGALLLASGIGGAGYALNMRRRPSVRATRLVNRPAERRG